MFDELKTLGLWDPDISASDKALSTPDTDAWEYGHGQEERVSSGYSTFQTKLQVFKVYVGVTE